MFSNPRVTLCGGRACGVENQADNARTLTQTMPVAATFRATVVPLSGKDDYNSDGKSDLLMVRNSDGVLCYFFMNGPTLVSNQCPGGVGNGYRIVSTGDFDGDRLPDVMWSNGYDLRLWTGNGAGGTATQQSAFTYDGSWSIEKSADMNSDGKTDLLATKNGVLCIYFMSGSSLASASCPGSAGASFRILATADFNGDGRVDLLWTNGNYLKLWFGNGAGAFSSMQDIGGYDGSWTMSAAADMNSDGKADILMAKDGVVCLLFMNGGTLSSSSCPGGAGHGFRILKTADFNGDGNSDILWSNGYFAKIWLGDGAGGLSENDFGGYDSAWTMN
ncbi:MAG: VCBS repeat-containing protein [Lysobacter sp.]|nr:VCBS repeat-containing protein [Lysobacter sp.]